MAHKQQALFCAAIRGVLPQYFFSKSVLDIGSMDINGNNRRLFDNCRYVGIDIGPGKNVDVICPGYLYSPDKKFDTIICTEVFEHDRYWVETIRNAISLLKPGSLFLFTCATEGRPEHGTTRTSTYESPYTTDYYMNITEVMIREKIPEFDSYFQCVYFSTENISHDLRFIGVTKGPQLVLKTKMGFTILSTIEWFVDMRIRDYKNFLKRLHGKIHARLRKN